MMINNGKTIVIFGVSLVICTILVGCRTWEEPTESTPSCTYTITVNSRKSGYEVVLKNIHKSQNKGIEEVQQSFQIFRGISEDKWYEEQRYIAKNPVNRKVKINYGSEDITVQQGCFIKVKIISQDQNTVFLEGVFISLDDKNTTIIPLHSACKLKSEKIFFISTVLK